MLAFEDVRQLYSKLMKDSQAAIIHSGILISFIADQRAGDLIPAEERVL